MFLEYSSGLKRSPTPARRSCPVKMKASVNPSGMSAVSCCLSSLCRNGLKFQESAAAVRGPRGSLICLYQRPCRLMEMAKDLAQIPNRPASPLPITLGPSVPLPIHCLLYGTFLVVLVIKNLPAKTGDIRDMGSIPGWGRSPGEEHGNPLQYSCLENPMDRGAWQSTVHGVVQSWTRLKRFSMHTYMFREGNGNPLQCSCLENPMDGEAW